jgi:hypothetical protein
MGKEAVRQIGFCDCGGGCFWAGLGRYCRHRSSHPMNRSGADAKCFSRFEDSCAGRQLLTDTLNEIGAHGARPPALGLARGSIDAASAITRLSVLNLILRGSGSGKPLAKDQGDSIDLENRKGR